MKKIISMILALSIACALCIGSVSASELVETRANTTIADCSVSIEAGSKSGKVVISYTVRANQPADSLGISSIVIYDSNDKYVTTIQGSTRNGLIESKSIRCRGDYTYTGTSGKTYYAVVTAFAKIGSQSDELEITTGSVKAP